MAKSAVIDDVRTPDDVEASAPNLNAGVAGLAASVSQSAAGRNAPAPSPAAPAPGGGDTDAAGGGMSAEPEIKRELIATTSSAANQSTSKGGELERAKALVKLKIIDWVRQQTRNDPASLALKMPYLQTRLKAWEDAKSSGDAGRMTKAYNDLLRGIEAEQNRRGIPKDEQRVLPNDMAEGIARGILNALPEKMLEILRSAKAQHGDYAEGLMKQLTHFMPQSLLFADSQSSKLKGEIIWRNTVATVGPTDLIPHLPESRDNPAQPPPGFDNAALLTGEARRDVPRAEFADWYNTSRPTVDNGPSRPSYDWRQQPDPDMRGMLRLERVKARRRSQAPNAELYDTAHERFVKPELDWADPEWDHQEVIQVLRGQSHQPYLTPEILQMLCNEVYEGEPADFARLLQQGGWELVPIPSPGSNSGYQAVAMYHPGSDSVVIINRGTDFSRLKPTWAKLAGNEPLSDGDKNALQDIWTDLTTFSGRVSGQLIAAAAFARAVASWTHDHHRTAKLVLTGHSLGGAAAQAQLAVLYAYREPNEIQAVTFAALGSADAMDEWARNNHIYYPSGGLEAFAADHIVNYVRRGDGFTYRPAIGPSYRSRVLGNIVDMAPVDPSEIARFENYVKAMEASSSLPGSPDRLIRRVLSTPFLHKLFVLYFRNHDLRSFYDPSFTSPLDSAIHQGHARRQRQPGALPMLR